MSDISTRIRHMGWNFPHPGGLDEVDIESLEKLVDKVGKEGMKIADVGCWTGTSTITLALASQKYSSSVKSVDWFQGSKHTGLAQASKDGDVMELLKAHLRYFDLNNVQIFNMTSLDAAKQIEVETMDLVFLDADHRYQSVKDDIEAWFPKVKPGGIIAGHDCEFLLTKKEHPAHPNKWDIMSFDKDNPWNEKDYISFHIGVVKAVSQRFDKRAKKMGPRIWWVQK